MKKTLSCFVTAVLMAAAMLPFSGITVSANDECEYAWFPLRTMALTQISFESASHGNSYHIDCSGLYEQCAFAPFTGKVVYTTKNYGLVLFQSVAPVHYADGSTDYMTVAFMHADNTDELAVSCANGTVIPQGTDFLRCGGIGKDGETEYAVHYDIGIYRGQLSAPPAYYSRIGNIYPFQGFYLNPMMTPSIVNMGRLNPKNTLCSGEYDNWENLWVKLPQTQTNPQGQQNTPKQEAKPEDTPKQEENSKPEQPVLSIQSGNTAEPVTISFQQCEHATYYNTRIYDSTHQIVYCVGYCKDAEPFGECRITDSTTITRQLPAGSYQVIVTAVNRGTGECTASSWYSFSVESAASEQTEMTAESITQMQEFLSGNQQLTAEQAAAFDLNHDGRINAIDLTMQKRLAGKSANAA